LLTLKALLSTFGLTKSEEQKIQEVIAEQLNDPTQEPPEISTPAPLPKKSRIEELAFSMEMVETQNQNPKTLGVRYNNPGCLKFALWEKQYGAWEGKNGFAVFPTYAKGKEAQLRLLRSAMTGRMPVYDQNGSINKFIRTYASSSPEIEKQNYVKKVCRDLGIPPTTLLKTLV
jgi:hypothetical protein